MPIVNVTGLTKTEDSVKDFIRKGIQTVFQTFMRLRDVELKLKDTKVTFVEDSTEPDDAPGIAQLVSKYLQDVPQSDLDTLCDTVIQVLETARKPYNEAYPIAVLAMRYRDNKLPG